MTKTSKTVYARAWALFDMFIKCFHNNPFVSVSLPLTPEQIIHFISYLNLFHLAPATITTYITAISFIHKMRNIYDPTAVFCVQKILCAVNKLHGKDDSRLPITLILLSRLSSAISEAVRNKYHKVLLKAMFNIAFFGLCRIGEITVQPDGIVALYLNQLEVAEDYISLSIIHFKHHRAHRPIVIKMFRQTDLSICPVMAMKNYIELRGTIDGPLFCFPDNQPVSRNFFAKHLKSCLIFCGLDVKQYSSHSFRIGAASYLASLGLSDTQIRTIGRWDSNAFLRYIRNQRYILNNSLI